MGAGVTSREQLRLWMQVCLSVCLCVRARACVCVCVVWCGVVG